MVKDLYQESFERLLFLERIFCHQVYENLMHLEAIGVNLFLHFKSKP
jgi:hypothetical protein